MTTAILPKPDLLAPLRHLLQWMLPSANTANAAPITASPSRHNAPVLIAACATPVRARATFDSQRKPLRIVRILESGQPRAAVGRMVISGRMADVCAELDRLVACEAA